MAKEQVTEEQQAVCLCGCGEPVERRFRPGHDQRLRGQLVRAHLTGDQKAMQLAKELGGHWTDVLEDAAEREQAKAQRQAEREGKAEAEHAKPELVTVKVGRWPRECEVLNVDDVGVQKLRYFDKKGGEHTLLRDPDGRVEEVAA